MLNNVHLIINLKGDQEAVDEDKAGLKGPGKQPKEWVEPERSSLAQKEALENQERVDRIL